MSAIILEGDCLSVMATLPDCSVDAVICDPPYELGFMGKSWDRTGVAFDPATWAEALRVAKPGAHLLAFGGSRTFHRIAVAIEDAGWEIRDTISWLYGSGFPKSLDVSKAIDKAAGAEREVVGRRTDRAAQPVRDNRGGNYNSAHGKGPLDISAITAPATDAAKEWEGWGTALKPAWEPIIVARKPFKGTVAANVQRYGTGAINIDGCRIGTGEQDDYGRSTTRADGTKSHSRAEGYGYVSPLPSKASAQGRWPANVMLDEDAARLLDEMTAGTRASKPSATGTAFKPTGLFPINNEEPASYVDSGGASRFFYVAKASASERGEGNSHPTVKPLKLLSYLCRLVTPPGGTVLDPFMGSGTTGVAALMEGFAFIGIEKEPQYVTIARRRIAAAEASRQPVLFAAD
jgi:site-specific DNA-methyltransferase (adenine-specific)